MLCPEEALRYCINTSGQGQYRCFSLQHIVLLSTWAARIKIAAHSQNSNNNLHTNSSERDSTPDVHIIALEEEMSTTPPDPSLTVF